MDKEKKNLPEKKRDMKMIRVALFCIAAVIIFYLGANFLKGVDVFGKKVYYYTVFDNLGGLTDGSPVMINGYKIGKITNINLLSDAPVKICAEIFVNEDVKIPKDSYFEVASKDILGGMVVNVIMGQSAEMARNKDTLSSHIAEDGLGAVFAKLDGVLSSVDTLLSMEGGGGHLKKSLANLESISSNFDLLIAENRLPINKMVEDLSVFTHTLKEAKPTLEQILGNFDDIADSLAKADIAKVIVDARRTLLDINEVVEKIKSGNGDISKLLNDDAIYTNLENSTNSLNLLLTDIKQNPGRYVHISLFNRKSKEERQAAKEMKKK